MSEPLAAQDIVVTARRHEERLQDTPLAISAFSTARIEDLSTPDLSSVVEFAPNVTFDPTAPLSGSSNAASIFIRGVGQTDFAITTDPGVGVYVDGVYLARATGADLDLLDVEQVEVLRGPQGTLFGRNTIGGAISVTSHAPSFKAFTAEAEMVVGNLDRFDVRAIVNAPLATNFAIRMAGSAQRRDGYGLRLLTGQHLGGQERYAARVSAAWNVTPEFDARIIFDYSKADEEAPVSTTRFTSRNSSPTAPETLFTGMLYNNLIGNPAPCQTPGFVAPFCGVPGLIAMPTLPAGTTPYDERWLTDSLYTSNGTGPGYSRYEIIGGTGLLSWQGDALHAKSLTGYRESDYAFGRDPDGSPLVLVHTSNKIHHRQFSQELELGGEHERVRWVVGGYFLDEFARDRLIVPFGQEAFTIINRLGLGCTLLPGLTGAPGPVALNPCPNPFFLTVVGQGATVDNQSVAAFGEATVKIGAGVSLTGGLRWTRDRKHVDLSGYFIGGAPFSPNPAATEHFTRVTPRVILDYKPTPDVMLYGSFATGYKSGGFNERYGAQLASGPTEFAPESVDSFELGGKAALWDGRARLALTLFHARYDDIQVVVFDNTIPRTINAAKGKTEGLEFEANLVPIEGITVQLSYGYTDARYTELDPAIIGSFGLPIVNPLRLSYAFVNTPKHNLSVGVEYAKNFDAGRLQIRGDVSYRSETANDAINTPELIQPGLALLRARAAFTGRDDHWTIALFGTNLTDERYIISGAADETGFARAEVNGGRPREWGLSATVRY